MKPHRVMKQCPDCGKIIWLRSKRCLSCSKKGKLSHIFGKHLTTRHKEKIAAAQRGSLSYNWKGNAVGRRSLHRWVRSYKKIPKLCEMCHKNPPYDLANKSGKYKRALSDWFYLCRRCHMNSDGRLERLHKGIKKIKK